MAVQKLDRTRNTCLHFDMLYIQPKGPIACIEFKVAENGEPYLELMPRKSKKKLAAIISKFGGELDIYMEGRFSEYTNPKEFDFLKRNGIKITYGMSPPMNPVRGINLHGLVNAGLISQEVALEMTSDAEKIMAGLIGSGKKLPWTQRLGESNSNGRSLP